MKKSSYFTIVAILILLAVLAGWLEYNNNPKETKSALEAVNHTEIMADEDLHFPETESVLKNIYTRIESKNLTILDEMENKNHHFVKYKENIFYRKYHKDSFELGGTNENYSAIPGAVKEMMCIYPDGSREELFTDQGNGAFYILQDRIYMTEADDASTIYSVDMQGKNYMEYGKGYIRAVDEDKNILILEIDRPTEAPFSEESDIYIVNGDTKELEILKKPESNSCSFLDYLDGKIYFQESESHRLSADSTMSKVTIRLYSIDPDGKNERMLAVVSDTANYRISIQKIQVIDDITFFSYGGHMGSAGAYQGGGIASVRTDGTGFQIIAKGNTEENYVSDWFYIQKSEEEFYIHYNRQFEMTGIDMVAKKLSSGELYHSDMPRQSGEGPGILFMGEGGGPNEADFGKFGSVYVIADHKGNIVEIAESIDRIPDSGHWDQTDTSKIRDLAYIDGYLYFTYEASAFDSTYSHGWREGFRRIGTACYRFNTRDNTLEQLYSY